MQFQPSIVWIQPGFLCFGRKPGLIASLEEDLNSLKALSIRAIFSLTKNESSLEIYREHGFESYHIPIADFQAPTQDQIRYCMSTLADLEVRAIPTYLHCLAGMGRSGTMAAAWLIQKGEKPLEAIGTIRRMKPGTIETDEQYNALLEYGAGL